LFTKTTEFMKASGNKTSVMEEDLNYLLMETLIKVLIIKVNHKEEASTLG